MPSLLARRPTPSLDETPYSLRGVQRLAGAMLLQAVEDIRCRSGKTRHEALHWVNSPSEEQFSFIHCCRTLERDPEEIRRFLDRHDIAEWLFSEAYRKDEASAAWTRTEPDSSVIPS